ncbi:hypothetical protein KQI63_04660 [bacterium]|nr:hypothetical protein [bacterium]
MTEKEKNNDFEWEEDSPKHEGDPYGYGREGHQTTWDRIRNTADRLMNRTLDVAGDVAQRGIIEVEIASLRMRLKNLYGKLGELIFRIKVAEERGDIFDDPGVLDLFEQIQATHREVANERAKLDELKEMQNRDEFAGA